MSKETAIESLVVSKGEKFSEAFKKAKIKDVVAAKVGEVLYDLSETATEDAEVVPISIHSDEGLSILRHSTAHLLANAIVELYPGAKPNAGPPTEDGFYYDFDMEPISSDDFEKIEKRMLEISKKNVPIEKLVLSRKDLEEQFKGNQYKLDKIEAKVPESGSSTAYRQGDFVDFCLGPHVPSTGYIRAFKLLSVASTHYKADENLPAMVRIYGTSFPDRKLLDEFLKNREEAAKRDHRRLAREMDLLVFNAERAPGFPLYTPNGTVIRNELMAYMRSMNLRNGWQEVSTPHIFKDTIWKQSGHYAKYKPDMFIFTLPDGDNYGVKPMNCPGHITIFERVPHSYRDLPIKYAEPGTVYRNEKSGEVGGLLRPRAFTQDDGHAFLRFDQIVDEVKSILKMISEIFRTIMGDVELYFDLSLIDKEKPENYLLGYLCKKCGNKLEARRAASGESLTCPSCGSAELEPDFSEWDEATEQLRKSLNESGLKYKEYPGEAAFYGPKIDVHMKDAIGRMWQLSTVQVDFFLPANFNLYYVNSESQHEKVVIIHRAIYGSYERFMAILLENFAGKLPTWLSPIQVYVIPVSESFNDYAEKVHMELKKIGVRSQLDLSSETISKKIKMIRPMRPAYIAVVGEKELEAGTVAIRNRADKQKVLSLDEFESNIGKEIKERSVKQMF